MRQPWGLVGIALLALGACAQPTPYQPAFDGHGFAEQQLEGNRFRVRFSGNAVTPRATVETYMLFRAAEVTLATGRDYFVVSDRDVDASTVYYSTTDTFAPGFRRRWGPAFGYGHTTSTPATSYETAITVVMYNGQKPAGDIQAYDAREVLLRLGPTIRRPGDEPARRS